EVTHTGPTNNGPIRVWLAGVVLDPDISPLSPNRRMPIRTILGRLHRPQVLSSVVQCIAVNMVGMLSSRRPVDEPMHRNLTAVDSRVGIEDVISSLPRGTGRMPLVLQHDICIHFINNREEAGVLARMEGDADNSH